MSTIRKITPTFLGGAILAAAIALPLSFAAAASELDGATLGKTADEVTASLVAQGYTVKKTELEDGLVEAYATKDGKRFEVYVSPEDGTVKKVVED